MRRRNVRLAAKRTREFAYDVRDGKLYLTAAGGDTTVAYTKTQTN